MKLLIHDLTKDEYNLIIHNLGKGTEVISDDHTIKNCIGCFGCWIKTPGACVIRDNYGDIGESLSKCNELIIISKCVYGGFSPFVKNVLDRGISYMHPFFVTRNSEMHHRKRYDNDTDLKVIFYGDNIYEKERQTAIKLVEANSINLGCKSHVISFNNNIFNELEVSV